MRLANICVIQLYGIAFILLGVVCVFGHVFSLPPLSTFGSDSDMAPPTAIGFIGLGTSYFFIAQLLGERSLKPFGSRNP